MLRYADFKNIRVRYSDTGRGRTIVLLHGFPESLEVWDEFSVKLSRHFRVIAIDLPGHGETPCIGYIHSMELMAHCVKSVMDDLGLRRYILAGHSMGGYAALAFAERYHDQVSGLCLFHSTSYPDSPEKKKDRDRGIALVKKDQRHYVNELIVSLFAPENVPVYREEIRLLKRIAGKTSRQGIINALEGMKERPKRDWILQYADYPVLYIIGKKDRVVPWESALEQATLAKNCQVVMLESAGHMGFIEEKQITQNKLMAFARKCFRKS